MQCHYIVAIFSNGAIAHDTVACIISLLFFCLVLDGILCNIS